MAPSTFVHQASATLDDLDSLMGMIRIILTTCLMGSMLVLAVTPASEGNGRNKHFPTKCPPPRAHILLADAQAAAYTIRENKLETIDGHHYSQAITATRSCDFAHKGSYLLNETLFPTPAEASAAVNHLTLDGAVLAYEEFISGVNRYEQQTGKTVWRIIVRNLRTGQLLHAVPTGTPKQPNLRFIGDGATTMIVLKSDGAVAWIVDHVEEKERYQVRAVDKDGNRVLAAGSNIDPQSLALAGNTLYWTQGGKPFSTTLQ